MKMSSENDKLTAGLRKMICRRKTQRAFTLMELLAVMTIMALLAVGGALSVNSINASSFGSTVYEISDMLRLARTSAIAQNTYVRVGFFQDAVNNRLVVAMVAGQTGQSTDFTTADPNNPGQMLFRYLSKPTKFDRTQLVNPSTGIPSTIPGLQSSSSPDFTTGTDTLSFTAPVAGAPQAFTSTIQYSPTGDATLSSGAAQWISLAIKPATGQPQNQAVIQLSGISGAVKVFRP